ncbi:MAG: hypothetical protein OHK0053_08990 [Microscillaceae bacterium]
MKTPPLSPYPVFALALLASLVLPLSALWAQDVSPLRLTLQLGHTYQMVEALTFSPNQGLVASAAGETILLWEVATGKEIRRMEGHRGFVTDLAFSPDGRYLLSVAWEGEIKLWNLAEGKEVRQFSGTTQHLYSVAFLPDGQHFLAGGQDGTVRVWQWQTAAPIYSLNVSRASVRRVAFQNKGSVWLAWAEDNTVCVWNNRGELLKKQQIPGEPRQTSTFHPSGPYLALESTVTAEEADVEIWNWETGQVFKAFRLDNTVPPKGLHALAFSPDGEYLLGAGGNGATLRLQTQAWLWHVSSNKKMQSFEVEGFDAISAAAFSPDGNAVLLGGRNLNLNGLMQYFPTGQNQAARAFTAEVGPIELATFSPDFRYILFGNGSPKLWDVQQGRIINSGYGETYPEQYVQKLAFSRDGQKVVVVIEERGQLFYLSYDRQSGQQNGFAPIGFSGEVDLDAFGQDSLFSQSTAPTLNLRLETPDYNSLRLIQQQTNRPLASLYTVFGNRPDFVLISPEGRFEGTPEGMNALIHFVMENEAIELEQLKERFYEPDLWKKLLGFSSEPLRPGQDLNRVKLYPAATLQYNPSLAQLELSLQDRGGGLGKVHFYINGMEMKSPEGVIDFNPKRQTLVKIPLAPYTKYLSNLASTLSVKVYHAEGWLHSRLISLDYAQLISKGNGSAGLENDDPPLPKKVPDFYAIVVGTSDYTADPAQLKDLRYPDKDAWVLAQSLEFAARNLFVDDMEEEKNRTFITLLNTDPALKNFTNRASLKTGGLATKTSIWQVFKEVAKQAKPEDVLVVYLSGHGVNFKLSEETDGQFYYLTRDMPGSNLQDAGLRQNFAISTEELIEWLNAIPAQKKVLILDACASGKAIDRLDDLLAAREVPSSQKRILELMKDRTGLFMISGSTSDAVSYEASPYGQGLLTYSLLLGMTGPALEKSEYIDVNQWFNFAANKVPELAREFSVSQQPQIAAPYKATSFVIGRVTQADRAKIQLSAPRPFFLRCVLQNDLTFADDLNLSEKLNSQLDEISSRGTQGRVVYLDVMRHPKAYQIRGKYEVTGNTIRVQCRVIKDDQPVGDLIIIEDGNKQDLDGLAEDILSQALKKIN